MLIEDISRAFEAARLLPPSAPVLDGPRCLDLGAYKFVTHVRTLPYQSLARDHRKYPTGIELVGGLRVVHYLITNGMVTTLTACDACPLGTEWQAGVDGKSSTCGGCRRSMVLVAETNPLLGTAFSSREGLIALAEERLGMDPLSSEILTEEWFDLAGILGNPLTVASSVA